MKKYSILIFFLTVSSALLFGSTSEAAVKLDNTEIGITFLKSTGDILEPPISPKPILPENDIDPVPQLKNTSKLPSTGDLITSLIWTLLGFSVIIVFIGGLSLKKVMLQIN